ncbi:type VI secretion system Vgr family protein [Pseudomonas knackmussii]|uniref:type VI secretion system Vgr family protein n=1 Tax=Pseudomonas knackmussii TaxID=65741 RepID=UPI003F49D5AE
MLDHIRPFFDHSRHKLSVSDCDAPLDVLAFEGEEGLSQPFSYHIEFTSSAGDIAAESMLGQRASFSLYAAPDPTPKFSFNPKPVLSLRTLHGVITAFKRLSGSRDEARYEVRLQPRLALLERGVQYRIYQNQSVPEIVEQVLRAAPHSWRGEDFLFTLSREYPRREQVMQYGESDLAFVQRILAESGLYYRITTDERLGIEVMEIGDSRQQYEYGHSLPLRPQSGLQSNAADSVWNLQASHEVVEASIFARSYNPREAWADLDAEVDLTRGAKTTYGEAYHYAEPYTKPGDAFAFDHEHRSDESFFHARLAHERYLNQQTRLSGTSSSATLVPGQVLKIDGGAPQAFEKGALIVSLTCKAARDSSYEVTFEAIPDADHYSFRPPLPRKPSIAGTVPARVTSTRKNDPYGHIDKEGRYKVQFLFDRDAWPAGQESMWLRLARPYAGDTHGLHLPLLAGTEVAVAFEQGDPDRPYIAHALHDSRNPDHVNLYNYKRNVLRTPANNKLRMDDERGKEHVKLSTEHSGKSQLNLGHLVDSERPNPNPRGAGFELRTDGHGAIRAGKGLFITADEQPRAQGQVLEMNSAMEQINQALELAQRLMQDAVKAEALPADTTQPEQLKNTLEQLQGAGLLMSAPAGIALTTPGNLQQAAGQNLIAVAGGSADTTVLKRFTVAAGEAISLFAKKLGLKFIANAGPVTLQAQNDAMQLLARHGLDIICSEGEIHFTAKKKIVLNGGGSYFSLSPAAAELGSGDFIIKARVNRQGPASMKATHPDYPKLQSAQRVKLRLPQTPNAPQGSWAGMPYTLYADGAPLQKGVLDDSGHLTLEHQVVTRQYSVELANGIRYQVPVPTDYRNPEQGQLANRGLHNHPAPSDDGEIGPLAAHTDHRNEYAWLLEEIARRTGAKQ